MRFLAAFLLAAAAAIAQTTAPMPYPQINLFSAGLPAAGAKLCTYIGGTNTPAATYVDSTGTTTNTNPVVLDVNGTASVWGSIGNLYKFVLISGGTVSNPPQISDCSSGTVIWTQDNVPIPVGLGSVVSSVNLLTGALTLAGTTNQITVTCAATTCTLSLPQAIATTSAVVFGSVQGGSSGGAGTVQGYGANNTNPVFEVIQIGGGLVASMDGEGNATFLGSLQAGGSTNASNAATFSNNASVPTLSVANNTGGTGTGSAASFVNNSASNAGITLVNPIGFGIQDSSLSGTKTTGITDSGQFQANGHWYNGSTTQPAVSCNGSGCTTCTGITNNDTRGCIQTVSGVTTVTITFAATYGSIPVCTVSSYNMNSPGTTTTSLTWGYVSASSTQNAYYICVQ